MKTAVRLAVVSALALFLGISPSATAVADGSGPYLPQYDCGGASAWDYYFLPRSIYTQDYIPYFAKHPPVYYSYPVPRTYGYSPYAYPPSTRTPEVTFEQPLTIRNPYVPPKENKSAEAPADPLARQPLRIRNPFVEQPEGAELAAEPLRKPQVVYPASLGRAN